MLIEVKNVKQIKNESFRRWFEDEDMDLIVWLSDDESITGFQLAYDKLALEHAVTWKAQTGYNHKRIDNGEEQVIKYKATPILVSDTCFSSSVVAQDFKVKATNIEPSIFNFVYEKLCNYPNSY